MGHNSFVDKEFIIQVLLGPFIEGPLSVLNNQTIVSNFWQVLKLTSASKEQVLILAQKSIY